jgi:hypothetical protein
LCNPQSLLSLSFHFFLPTKTMAAVDIPRWMWALADDYPFAPPPPVSSRIKTSPYAY